MSFAYFRTTDNTIAEMELEGYDSTSGTYGIDLANTYAEVMGFELIEFGGKWHDRLWEEQYAALEERGLFTPERAAELFDTGPLGRFDQAMASPDSNWVYED